MFHIKYPVPSIKHKMPDVPGIFYFHLPVYTLIKGIVLNSRTMQNKLLAIETDVKIIAN